MEYREEAYRKSIQLLETVSTPQGFLASCENTANYKRVWARDGVIAGLAALVSGNGDLIGTFSDTLTTLMQYQDETGRIPSNISLDGETISYGTTVGRIDATIWYVIGVTQYALRQDDLVWFENYRDSVSRALFYLRCLELNGHGLIYIPYGGDWADEYINHGYVLFDQMLYLFALRGFARIMDDEKTKAKASELEELIRVNYFPKEENKESVYVYNKMLFKEGLKEYRPPFPVPYFSSHSVRYHIDNFANSLVLLSGIMHKKDADIIRDTMITMFLNNDFPIMPAFHPVIEEGDDNWERLQKAYLFEFKNKPYEYHNGGLWPLVNGFFLSSVFFEKRMDFLKSFANILKRDDFLFPEYYHGKEYTSRGTPGLGFSAAGYIFSYQGIVHNKKLLI